MAKKQETHLQNTSKPRKVTSGPLRNKERTKKKLLNAVGSLLQKKGYYELTAFNIAKEAGLNKRLIWTYFGTKNNLIEEYIRQSEFWKTGSNTDAPQHVIDEILEQPEKAGRKETAKLLQAQFDAFSKDIELQKVIHWEMGEKSDLLRRIADQREALGESLLSLIDPYFENTDVDVRATIALMIGGIYYLNLHARQNGSTCCGIDINIPEGRERIVKALEDNINRAFDAAAPQK